MAWQHSGLSNICSRISFESAFYPFKRALTDAERAECTRLFDCLEPHLESSGGPFLFGRLSLADLMLIPHLAFMPDFAEGAAMIAPHANLAGWIERVKARPSMAATDWSVLLQRFPVAAAA